MMSVMTFCSYCNFKMVSFPAHGTELIYCPHTPGLVLFFRNEQMIINIIICVNSKLGDKMFICVFKDNWSISTCHEQEYLPLYLHSFNFKISSTSVQILPLHGHEANIFHHCPHKASFTSNCLLTTNNLTCQLACVLMAQPKIPLSIVS